MKRNYKRLDRMYESHDVGSMQIPQEVLDMTVGDMLKKLELEDTPETSHYETVEDAIMQCIDFLVGSGYGSDSSYTDLGSIEDADAGYSDTTGSNSPEEMVSFEEMPADLYGQERANLDDFTF